MKRHRSLSELMADADLVHMGDHDGATLIWFSDRAVLEALVLPGERVVWSFKSPELESSGFQLWGHNCDEVIRRLVRDVRQ